MDDILITSTNKEEIIKLKYKSLIEFDMKDHGEAKKIPGMKIQKDRNQGRVRLNQNSYLKKVLHKFKVGNTNSVTNPLTPYLI